MDYPYGNSSEQYNRRTDHGGEGPNGQDANSGSSLRSTPSSTSWQSSFTTADSSTSAGMGNPAAYRGGAYFSQLTTTTGPPNPASQLPPPSAAASEWSRSQPRYAALPPPSAGYGRGYGYGDPMSSYRMPESGRPPVPNPPYRTPDYGIAHQQYDQSLAFGGMTTSAQPPSTVAPSGSNYVPGQSQTSPLAQGVKREGSWSHGAAYQSTHQLPPYHPSYAGNADDFQFGAPPPGGSTSHYSAGPNPQFQPAAFSYQHSAGSANWQPSGEESQPFSTEETAEDAQRSSAGPTRRRNSVQAYPMVDVYPESTDKRRDHICEVCGKAFQTAGYLARHRKVHSAERPHTCPIPGCPSKFNRHDNMLQHWRSHARRLGEYADIPRPPPPRMSVDLATATKQLYDDADGPSAQGVQQGMPGPAYGQGGGQYGGPVGYVSASPRGGDAPEYPAYGSSGHPGSDLGYGGHQDAAGTRQQYSGYSYLPQGQ